MDDVLLVMVGGVAVCVVAAMIGVILLGDAAQDPNFDDTDIGED